MAKNPTTVTELLKKLEKKKVDQDHTSAVWDTMFRFHRRGLD